MRFRILKSIAVISLLITSVQASNLKNGVICKPLIGFNSDIFINDFTSMEKISLNSFNKFKIQASSSRLTYAKEDSQEVNLLERVKQSRDIKMYKTEDQSILFDKEDNTATLILKQQDKTLSIIVFECKNRIVNKNISVKKGI